MTIRDRIKHFRRVPASQLKANPRNWRTHPSAQRSALQGVLAEIGFASALVARECDDGTLELIDGHLRAGVSGDELVPVLVLDVDEAEAKKLLVTLDPLSAMAGRDQELLDDLLRDVDTSSESLAAMLADLAKSVNTLAECEVEPALSPEPTIPELFQVVVQCADEDAQRELFEELSAQGHRCRLLMT